MNENCRNVVHRRGQALGSSPEGESLVQVEVSVKFLPYGENELIAHYLTNQIARQVVAEVDRQSLERASVELNA